MGEALKKIDYYCLKLPLMYGLILGGFIFSFIVELPFSILVWIHEIGKQPKRGIRKKQ